MLLHVDHSSPHFYFHCYLDHPIYYDLDLYFDHVDHLDLHNHHYSQRQQEAGIVVLESLIRYVKPGVTIFPAVQKRAVTPACSASSTSSTSIPAYASSCRSPSQYASACSCNGIVPSTRTLAAVVVSSTSTPLTTVTVTTASIATVPDTTITTSTTLTTTTITSTLDPAGPTCSAMPNAPDVFEGCPNGTYCKAGTYQCSGSTNDETCSNFCNDDPKCITYDSDEFTFCIYYRDCCDGN